MDTRKVYDDTADRWGRQLPDSLSDFTARPHVFSAVGQLSGESVFDIGCGEGYCARVLKQQGAGDIVGVDLSEHMIDIAKAQEAQAPLGIDYRAANIVSYQNDRTFDLCVAVFLFNYLKTDEMHAVMKLAYDALVPGGRFLFTIPHPFFPFLDDRRKPPFFFEQPESDYFSSQNQKLEGEIWKRSGESLHVQCVHKTFDSYFDGLAAAGFSKMPLIKELSVTEEHLALDRDFFEPIMSQPLHVLFVLEK